MADGDREQALKEAVVAGPDGPRTWVEFARRFPDDRNSAQYLEQLRWPEGFVWSACGAKGAARRQWHGRLTCPTCRHQSNAIAGTIFEKTRTPLTVWFTGAWQVTIAKNGLSAMTLASTLGVNYRVAWSVLHRYGIAMVRAERQPFGGTVEVDETLVGGAEHAGKRGRGVEAAALVVIAIEICEPKGFGRVRTGHVPDASGDSLVPFVRDVVAGGTLVHTDGWGGYNALPDNGYRRKKSVLSASPDPGHVAMPGVDPVASLLERWTLGTHQGSVDPAHLQSYLRGVHLRVQPAHLAVPRAGLVPAHGTGGHDRTNSRGRHHPSLPLAYGPQPVVGGGASRPPPYR